SIFQSPLGRPGCPDLWTAPEGTGLLLRQNAGALRRSFRAKYTRETARPDRFQKSVRPVLEKEAPSGIAAACTAPWQDNNRDRGWRGIARALSVIRTAVSPAGLR